jgi:hypothetical protein
LPFTVNYLNDTSANGGIPATTTSFVAGCYVGKHPTTTFAGVNLGVASVSGGPVAYIIHKFKLNHRKH